MMEAPSSSEPSVFIRATRHNIPEDAILQYNAPSISIDRRSLQQLSDCKVLKKKFAQKLDIFGSKLSSQIQTALKKNAFFISLSA
jgi:hypothetical protein